ncbi:MAG: hypothetical protein PHX80_03875 [Candidatus Nanoarchaeia archaeon]|nr:hypothetical protein [Candidatus Nanoarchaeia archaeon]
MQFRYVFSNLLPELDEDTKKFINMDIVSLYTLSDTSYYGDAKYALEVGSDIILLDSMGKFVAKKKHLPCDISYQDFIRFCDIPSIAGNEL